MTKSSDVADRRASVAEAKEAREAKNQDFKNQATLAKLHLAEVTGENKQYLDSLKLMIQMKKNGVEPDPKELQKTLDGLQSYGVDKDFVQYLTGQQGGAPTPGGDPMEDELGGR